MDRKKLFGYYDDYIFNVVFNDDDEFDLQRLEHEIDEKDIESDYKNCIRIIQQEVLTPYALCLSPYVSAHSDPAG